MVQDQTQHRVVLIFGNPGSGKSTLAKRLHTSYGYHTIELDKVYVTYIREQYSDLYMPALRRVVAPHFEHIFSQFSGNSVAWRDHVVALAEGASRKHQLVSIEGYLLLPVLLDLQKSLADAALVTIVEVRNGQYFLGRSIEEIHSQHNVPIGT